MSIVEPSKISVPFADSGLKNSIPQTANNTTGKAGFDKGFPERTMLPKASGGIPPSGMDFNGILYDVTSAIRYMQAGGKPTYDAAFAAAIGGYPLGAVLIGDDGVSVFQNAVAGNETDPNSGGAGWTRPDLQVMELYRRSYAEAGYNVVGTFQAGFTLVNANDVGIDEVTGKGYTGPAGAVAAGTNPASGGFIDRSEKLLRSDVFRFTATGSFTAGGSAVSGVSCLLNSDGFFYTPKAGTITVPAGSSPDASWICVGLATMSKTTHSLFDFGCVDDNGVTDNRSRIQAAVEYMEHFKSKLNTDSSSDSAWFGVSTFSQLPLAGANCIVLRKPRNINIEGGRNRNSSIKYVGTATGDALFALMAGADDWGMSIKSLGASGGGKLNYVLDGHDVWYAQSNIEGGCYEDAALDAIHLSCYMSSFKRVFANNTGRDGIALGGPDSEGGWSRGTSTSINLDNCWARSPTRYGFSVANELWYSEWSSTGCDGSADKRVEMAYNFNNAKGVTLNGIGAEYCVKLLRAASFRGLVINGIQMSRAGPSTGVADNCIELVSGFDATIAGFSPVDAFNSKYTNILHVSGATGNEFVNILDMSIRSDKIAVTKAIPGGFYQYPEIVYFAVSASRDRGFARTGNVLNIPPYTRGINIATTHMVDTILCRELTFKTSAAVVKELFVQTSGGDFDAVIDISSIDGTSSDYAQLYVYKRDGVTSFKRPVGAPVSGWAFSTPGSGCRITVYDTTSRVFFVKIRFISQDSVVEFRS